MSESEVLGHLVRALASFFVADATVDETLLAVSELATEAIPAAAFAGMSLWSGEQVVTRAYTDAESPEVDAAQYESNSGPGLDAVRQATAFRIDDTAHEDRWPAFAQRCVERGIHATLSVPLMAKDRAVGALTLYAREVGAFRGTEPEASLFASLAAAVVSNAQAYWDAHQLSLDLTDALSSRATIEQAKGILMAQSRVGAEEAFELLVRASQRENRKVRDIAAEIVAGAQR